MSLHRGLAPPPLALAVHPAPPPKTREEIKKEDERRREERHAKAKAEAEAKEAAAKAKAEPAAVADAKDKKSPSDAPLTPESNPASPAPAPANETGSKHQDQDKSEAKDEAPKPEVPLPPLRLLPPVPHRPVRSKLDLNPIRPYPPINTDPRGAYHKYAKAIQNDSLYIDVTKDGWLTEQWRGKSEREALARLTGEAERQRQREVAKAKMASVIRRVPDTADALILELWNDLVEAESHEVSVDSFWAKYDWSDPKAEKHLQVMPTEEKEKVKAAEIERVEREVKAEEAAKVAARANREKEKKEEDEKRKKEEADKEAGKEEGKKEAESETKVQSAKKEEKATEPAAAETKTEEKVKKEPEPPAYKYTYPLETEWTREGVEEILATIGIHCLFNTEKPLPRHWSIPGSSYLLLAHDHFLLRIDSDIQFKPEGTTDKFEALVTSANDRVFGEMVKAQINAEKKKREREYRDRKEREYKEKKEKERKERKEKEKVEGEEGDADDQEKKAEAEDKAEKEKKKEEELKPHKYHPNGSETPKTSQKAAVAEGAAALPDEDVRKGVTKEGKEDVAVVAVPVKRERAEGLDLDQKHEQEPQLVGAKVEIKVDADAEGRKADEEGKKKAEDDDKAGGDKKPDDEAKKAAAAAAEAAKRKEQRHKAATAADAGGFDPERDADLLIKMLGPEAANIPLADLKAAFAAMEEAAAESKARAHADEKKGPMMWVWHEPCERWRWRNFAAGCAVIEPGGWEERDWRLFADGAGVLEYENEMEWEEVREADLHDWSC